MHKDIGKYDPPTIGDVYIGVRPKNKNFHPFKGFMSGVTILAYAVSSSELTTFQPLVFTQIFRK